MSFQAFLKVRPARWALCRLALWRVKEKLAVMGTYLDLADRVLDVGAGNCILCQELDRLGYHVVPVDLQNLSFVDEIVPVIYDGMRLPLTTIVSTWLWSSPCYTTLQIRTPFSLKSA